MPSPPSQHALLVPAQDVKAVKTLLESHGRLSKTRKIEAYIPALDFNTSPTATGVIAPAQKLFLVPLRAESSASLREADAAETHDAIAALLPPDLRQTYPLLPLSAAAESSSDPEFPGKTSESNGKSKSKSKNPLHAAFSVALSSHLPPSLLSSLVLEVPALVSSLPTAYLVYAPLLLLPAHAFTSEPWQRLLSATKADGGVMRGVWARVAEEMGVKAVAVNAAIPLGAAAASSPGRDEQEEIAHDESKWNVLRSPTGLTPLYGSFGPRPRSTCTTSTPSPADLSAALWVSTRQNGIAQVWAPLYTMFSRGNVKEKARLLDLLPKLHAGAARTSGLASSQSLSRPRQKQALQHVTKRSTQREAFTTLDLYAGIGYFAFSHRRAAARPVVCWELNPWSIEGLRRGAAANGWTTTTIPSTFNTTITNADQHNLQAEMDADFIIFPHTNAAALSDLAALAARGVALPPVCHVNAGLLPSSRGAWRTAVRAVDACRGGWLHLHENFGAQEMQARADEVMMEVGRLWRAVRAERMGWEGRTTRTEGDGDGEGKVADNAVKLVHLEKVKTYAPGVWHVVLDVWVPPSRPRE